MLARAFEAPVPDTSDLDRLKEILFEGSKRARPVAARSDPSALIGTWKRVLTQADLATYEPVVRPALVSRAGGWALSTTPPPSVGGICLTAMLRLLLAHPFVADSRPDPETFSLVRRHARELRDIRPRSH